MILASTTLVTCTWRRVSVILRAEPVAETTTISTSVPRKPLSRSAALTAATVGIMFRSTSIILSPDLSPASAAGPLGITRSTKRWFPLIRNSIPKPTNLPSIWENISSSWVLVRYEEYRSRAMSVPDSNSNITACCDTFNVRSATWLTVIADCNTSRPLRQTRRARMWATESRYCCKSVLLAVSPWCPRNNSSWRATSNWSIPDFKICCQFNSAK